MQIKTQYMREWEEGRKRYQETMYIEEGKEEITLQTMYPKWIAWLDFKDYYVMSTPEFFRGESKEEVKQKVVEWMKEFREKLNKIIGDS